MLVRFLILLAIVSTVLLGCKKDDLSGAKYLNIVKYAKNPKINEISDSNIVEVTGDLDIPYGGVDITVSVMEGEAKLTDYILVTNKNGEAYFQLILSDNLDPIKVKVSAPQLEVQPLNLEFLPLAEEPAKIEVIDGNNQGATYEKYLPEEIKLLVTDINGKPVRNVRLTYDIIKGDGNVSSFRSSEYSQYETSVDGIASFRYRVGKNEEALNQIKVSTDNGISTIVNAYNLVRPTIEVVANEDNILISWEVDPDLDIKSYNIYKGNSSWGAEYVKTINDKDSTFYYDYEVLTGEKYYYKVEYVTNNGDSTYSYSEGTEFGYYLSDFRTGKVLFDKQNNLLYAANGNNVNIASTETYEIVDQISISSGITSIAFSKDNSKVIVGDMDEKVSIINKSTKELEESIDVSLEINSNINDLFVTSNNFIYVSGFGLGTNTVIIDPEDSYTKKIVYNSYYWKYIGDDGEYLYLGISFLTPNSLLKKDLTDTLHTDVLESEHGTISGMNSAILNSSGTIIYTQSGQLISTSDFSVVNTIEDVRYSDYMVLSDDEESIYFAFPNRIEIYSTSTLNKIKEIPTGIEDTDHLFVYPDESVIVISTDNKTYFYENKQ